VVFWGFSNSTGESILNSLKAVYLGDVYVQEERELQWSNLAWIIACIFEIEHGGGLCEDRGYA